MADFSLGTAELGVVVDLHNLDAGIAAAQQKAGDGFTIMGGTIANVLGNALSAAGGIVLNQVGNIFGAVSAGVASNMQFETFEVQFGVLLKSTEAAKERIAELAQFGAETPFDLPGVVEADKILQGFGLHSQESAEKFGYAGTDIRRIAGDVAAGTGQNFQDISLYLGKFSAGATGEAISRFQELGITTREELTKMGVQFSKSGELVSPLPEAMNVILGVMKDKYGGMMADQSATLEGMLSNFGDWKEGALRTLAAPIFDIVKNSLDGFLKFVNANSAQITTVLTSIGTTIGTVLGGAIDFVGSTVIPGFTAAWRAMQPAIQAVSGYIGTAVTVFNQIVAVIQRVQGVFEGSRPAMTTFSTTIAGVTGPISGANTALNNLAAIAGNAGASIGNAGTVVRGVPPIVALAQAAFASLSTAILSMVQSATPVLNGIITLVQSVMQSVAGAITQNSGLIVSTFSNTFTTIVNVVSTVFNAVMGVVSAVLGVLINLFQTHGTQMMSAAIQTWSVIRNTISSIISAVAAVISAVFGQIATFINANQSSISNTIATVWNAISGIVSGVVQIIGAIVTTVFGAIAAFIAAHGAQIQAVLTAAWNLIASIVTTALNLILGIVNVVLAAINGNWSAAWSTLQQVSASFVMGIVSVIGNALNFIASLFGTSLSGIAATWSGAWQGISGAASSVWGSITGLASGFVAGLIGIIQSAVAGLQGAAQAGLDAILGVWNGFTDWAGIGGDVIDGIIKGISGGIGALKDAVMGAASSALDAAKSFLGISSPSKKFADEVGGPTAEGILQGFMDAFPKVNTNIIKGITLLMESVAKIAADGAKALAILSEFKGTGNQGMISFLDSIEELARRFSATADELGGKILGTANRFSETAGKVAGMVGDAVESLNKLADFIVPTRQSIQTFGDTLAIVVGNIAYVASLFQSKAIEAGAKFAQGASDILSVVGDAVDAFSVLPSVVAVSRDVVARFGGNLIIVIEELVAVSRNWTSQSITTAAALAESITSLVGIIGTAVDNFAKLTLFAEVPRQTIQIFANSLWQVVHELALVARLFSAESLDAAKLFSDGIGGIIGVIGTAVDNFAKLIDFAEIPRATITTFANTLWQVVHELAIVARMFNTQSLDAAKIFSDAVSNSIGVIALAIDSFDKLLTLTDVPQAVILMFVDNLYRVFEELVQASEGFNQQSYAAAKTLSDGIGESMSVIGRALDGMAKLNDFVSIPQSTILSFVDSLYRVFEELGQASEYFSSASYAAAKSLADGIGESMSVIGRAIDSFTKLKEFEAIPQKTILSFVDTLYRVFEELTQASEYFGPAAYAAAKALSDGIGDSMAIIGKAIDGFSKLKEFEAVPQKTILSFVDTLYRVFEELVQASEGFNAAAYAAAKSLAEGIGNSMDIIGKAIDQFSKLLDFKAPSKDIINAFTSTLTTFVSEMTKLVLPASQDIGVQMIAGVIKGIQSQTSALTKALDDAMNAALEGVKKTLGIASPSQLFEDQVGTNIASGIAKGMDKINDPNFGALLGMTDRFRSSALATAATSPLASNASATYSDHYTVNATYRHQEESTIRDDLQMVHMLRGKR